MNKEDVLWIGALAFFICSIAAVLELISGNYIWFIIDVLFAASNIDWTREWLKSLRQ